MAAWRDARAARRARVASASCMPDLLERLGHRFAAHARWHDVHLSLEVDPALETDLVGPFRGLGEVLQHLLSHAIEHARGSRVTLSLDVVGDAPGYQDVHFTVASPRAPASPFEDEPAAWRAARQRMETLGGSWHLEQDDTLRLIAGLRFIVPPGPPHVDVRALRDTLGSEAAMRDVIDALGDALAADVGHLEGALARGDTQAVRQWLHRVSGALGMAEATGLAAMGAGLERATAHCPLPDMELAVRRFAMDATRALAWLREERGA